METGKTSLRSFRKLEIEELSLSGHAMLPSGERRTCTWQKKLVQSPGPAESGTDNQEVSSSVPPSIKGIPASKGQAGWPWGPDSDKAELGLGQNPSIVLGQVVTVVQAQKALLG